MGNLRSRGYNRVIPALAILFAGCAVAAPEPIVRAVEVKVPIATPVYCDPPALPRPVLPIAQLTPTSSPADTVRDYAATVDVLKGAVIQRDDELDGCRAPAVKRGAQ
jgi:hypothetical protein